MAIDKTTGLLANEATLPDNLIYQLTLDLPPVLHPWARDQELLLLDDLLLASHVEGETAVSSLRLISPDPNTIYRLSPALPPEAQKIHMEAVSVANLSEITLWMDGTRVAVIDSPPFEAWWQLTAGTHVAWVEGVDENGRLVHSNEITFKVVDSETGESTEPQASNGQ
jgi:hypothetical protein